MPERWLNVEEIASHLGVAPITIYRWIEKGVIPSHRVGKFWRFKVSEIDQWVGAGDASDSKEIQNRSNKLKKLNSGDKSVRANL